jgi:biopolymer transport protein ExbD
MAGGASSEEGAIYDINVTPLVDITLVLLIIMMVTAKVIVQTGMPMELPKSASGEEVEKTFSLDISKDGKVYHEKKAFPDDESLIEKAKEAKKKDEEVRVVLRADEAVEHGEVVRVLDVLKKAGLIKVAFAVTPVAPLNDKK